MKKHLSAIFLSAILFWCSAGLVFAQSPVKGTVWNENGGTVSGAMVSIDGSDEFKTNKSGSFQMLLPGEVPVKIRVTKKGRELEVIKFDYRKDDHLIDIIVKTGAPVSLNGKIILSDGRPGSLARVVLDGVDSQPVNADADGNFLMELPSGSSAKTLNNFIVNGTKVGKRNLKISTHSSGLSVVITVPAQGTSSSENTTQENPQETTSNSNGQQDGISRIFHVVMYDANSNPVTFTPVRVEDGDYTTDSEGRFEAGWDARRLADADNILFDVEGFDVVKKHYDDRINHMYIYVKKPAEEGKEDMAGVDTVMADYAVHFHRIVSQLEMRKQLLIEKSTHIRDDIEDIAIKLDGQQLTLSQREQMGKHLLTLQNKLIETDLAFEEVEEKTHSVIDKMESAILNSEKQRLDLEEEFHRDIAIFVTVTLILVVIIIGSFRAVKRIRRQNLELEEQGREIQVQKAEIEIQKEKIEVAYRDIKELSIIGQEITAALDFKTLVRTVNKHIASLLGASSFGVGILNETENELEFMEFVRNNKTINRSVPLSSNDRLSVACLKSKQKIVINDLHVEWKNHLETETYDLTDKPHSLIYLPLMIENKAIGVITVQSSRKNAYSELDVEVLQTLDSYIAIALYNANVYEDIHSKNKNITDSIRYAQTIQEAILPTATTMSRALKEYFVVYKPKDIVSGDFYWFSSRQNDQKSVWVLAAVDCTGHGVPGAFMSMVGNNLLNEIVNQKRVYDASLILETLDAGVRIALKQEEKGNDDGMDVCLCVAERNMDEDFTTLTFSGARRPLYFLRAEDGKLQRLRGNLRSVGGNVTKKYSFGVEKTEMRRGDIIYLTSDGYVSQHSASREKFGSERFEALLAENASLPMKMQKIILEKSLADHGEGVEQRDDVTVIGVKF